MKTKHTSFIPMSPGVLPRQRLNEVTGLPVRPDGLDVSIERESPLAERYPKGSPRKTEFVCSVEWAWSPVHHRIDNYYLNPKPKRWILWNNWLNDWEYPWAWHWDVLAYAPRVEVEEFTLATHLLLETWKYLATHEGVDHYHWVNSTGCLSVEDIQAVAREVW